MLKLAFADIAFADLYRRSGLVRLDQYFTNELREENIDLWNQLMHARAHHAELSSKDESALILALAPFLENFIVKLFGIENAFSALTEEHLKLAPIYLCKRLFVQRQAAKKFKPAEVENFNSHDVQEKMQALLSENFSEILFAQSVCAWMDKKDENIDALNVATTYAAWALYHPEGIAKHQHGALFKQPQKHDSAHFVPVETVIIDGVEMQQYNKSKWRQRDGFSVTDAGGSLLEGLDEANYCIWCHHQGKDSCSKGLREKDGKFKRSEADINLAGCPLEEKISEMHQLKSEARPLGALAVITLDNPMCAATGHRICNDCMKSCIYQKQEPVNIPKSETRILTDILKLPYGFEIYSLLTRWNPLNFQRPLPKKTSGYKVLVAGLGPAGFTLSHHLLNEGHIIVAVDGLKIEPLPEEISGVTQNGRRTSFKPIRDIEEIFEDLSTRKAYGFGGVAEYGITVRWNKNFLTLIRLLLERRFNFSMIGGVRFGSTITIDDAWNYGFDHVALAMGAGKPTLLPIPNALAKGVRTASDFLMALQLTGAARKETIANLEMRLPVVVIGGGLTAVDTATEALAYYPIQVEKFLLRYDALVKIHGEEKVKARWNTEELAQAAEFIAHAKILRAEKSAALRENRQPDFISHLQNWGGATVAYRKTLQDAPSYRLNHEEVAKAMEEGIRFLENATPEAVEIDATGSAKALKVLLQNNNGSEVISLPARSIFIAAGTQPNTVLARETENILPLAGKYFQAIDVDGQPLTPEYALSKPSSADVLMYLNDNRRYVSFFGDLHPSFFGNVVKAMGAAKQGYPTISKVLNLKQPANALKPRKFIRTLNQDLRATVHEVVRLTSNIVEIFVKAPAAARRFEPGQFYRFQNFESFSLRYENDADQKTILATEGLALTGAWVNKKRGLLSTIVLEMGGSSDLCAFLKKGEPVIVMGPTGAPTEIPANKTVLLAGGGLGNAVLFSIGKALRNHGSKVLYFAGYKKEADRYKVTEIEEAADVIIWACDEATFKPERPQDFSFHGNIVKAMEAYASDALGETKLKMHDVSHIIAIGSDRMMAAVGDARHNVLKPYLAEDHHAIGSINSPMQCMMKEICAQCLQRHVDPKTGKEYYVYSCQNQDQCLDSVDFSHLRTRLSQNSTSEKLTAMWIDNTLRTINLRK
jgi:NADPH-dependent glutamate synthase beta subunit-like oxidoreductase/NAD(P)H-flavin reductase